MIAVITLIGVIALAVFWISWMNDRRSSAPGMALAVAVPCLLIAWIFEGLN